MAKRIFDVVFSASVLMVTAPLLLLVAIGIRLSDPGPALYRAARQGSGENTFTLYKFRTMRRGAESEGAITALSDDRVFPLGRYLRSTKLDELPQFWNVLKGEMSVVGPRPEDPDIVKRCYTNTQRRTLQVRPGIASPGSIFNYTHATDYLDEDDVGSAYEQKLLPVKLGLELAYVDNASLGYDLRIIGRTLLVVTGRMFGRRNFALPPEYAIAEQKGYFDG